MASGYTVFMSYLLESDSGYSKSIHCNYFNSVLLYTKNPYIEEVSIGFSDPSDFKFLSSNILTGTGYTANKIHVIIQLVNNSGFTYSQDIKPDAAKWKIYEVTSQIIGHVAGDFITATEMTSQAFKVPLLGYNSFASYVLHDFINYPTKEVSDDEQLCFGDEVYFFGNVKTDIKAIAYTTNIPIQLGLNEFNTSTNLSWTQDDVVSISEIGIYDANKNLVAIGKLNNPIKKDASITRTILFALDF